MELGSKLYHGVYTLMLTNYCGVAGFCRLFVLIVRAGVECRWRGNVLSDTTFISLDDSLHGQAHRGHCQCSNVIADRETPSATMTMNRATAPYHT